MVRAPTLARCLHPDKPHHCTEVTAQVSPQVLRFPPACPPPTPAAPTAQEGGPRPAAPVTFEPGAPRPSDPRASLSPLVPPPRVRGRGREESDAAGHLPFSPALPAARRPRRLRRSRGRRLPLRSSPSRSFLFHGSLDTRPGRGAGEAVTGPADRTPTPGVHHPPGSRPAQASPLSTRTPRPKLRLLKC